MAQESTALINQSGIGLTGHLDRHQLQKASSALLKHITSTAAVKESKTATKNLLASHEDASASATEPIWLILTTKKHIITQPRLKPGKILLPNPMNTSPLLSVCLIVPEPQRQFKDAIAHASFPPTLAKRITRIIDIKKLEKKYHSFEAKAQLRDSHEIFLADDRIITFLPKLLGKTFLAASSKRPIPVRLAATKPKSTKANAALPSTKRRKAHDDLKSITTPELIAKEIERTLSMTLVNLSPSVTTAVKVALASFKPEQVVQNLEAVITAMIDKYVPRNWRGVKAMHIKGPNTMALPIWLADQLWDDEEMVLEDGEAAAAKEKAQQKGKRIQKLVKGSKSEVQEQNGSAKKRKADHIDDNQEGEKKKRIDEGLSQEMRERREKLRQQKRDISAKNGKSEEESAVNGVKISKKKKLKEVDRGAR